MHQKPLFSVLLFRFGPDTSKCAPQLDPDSDTDLDLEADLDFFPQAQFDFSAYLNWLPMPHRASRSNSSFWFSFDYLGVHVLSFSTEHDFSPNSTQHHWIQQVERYICIYIYIERERVCEYVQTL